MSQHSGVKPLAPKRTERREGVRHDGDVTRERVQLVERLQDGRRHHPYVGNPSGPMTGHGYPNRISTETPPVARCPQRQKSRVGRLKAKVKPLVTVDYREM